jgi:hypothetical protein
MSQKCNFPIWISVSPHFYIQINELKCDILYLIIRRLSLSNIYFVRFFGEQTFYHDFGGLQQLSNCNLRLHTRIRDILVKYSELPLLSDVTENSRSYFQGSKWSVNEPRLNFPFMAILRRTKSNSAI